MQTFFRKISNRKFSETLGIQDFFLWTAKIFAAFRSKVCFVHPRVGCIKNVPWLDNIKLNVVTNWGPFFFYYCYYKLWESLLNSEYMPLLSTREKRWDSNNFPFQSHHGVSSVMVKLDQILHQWSHFLPLKKGFIF